MNQFDIISILPCWFNSAWYHKIKWLLGTACCSYTKRFDSISC